MEWGLESASTVWPEPWQRPAGMGLISTAQIGFREPDFKTNFVEDNLRAIRNEFKKAREIAPEGAIGFNIMVATNTTICG